SDQAELLERAKQSRAKENVLEILEPPNRKKQSPKKTAAASIPPIQPTLEALERQKQLYRLAYEELSRQVRPIPGFENSPTEKVDIGVAMFVLIESEDPNEVGRVLSQSDRVREWKKSLPEDEYQAKFITYIVETQAQAQNLLRQQDSQRLVQQKNKAFDLER
ncbi:MAG: hypothetical protein ACRDEA_23835, partial [Microcystaceae cyanobacterium]